PPQQAALAKLAFVGLQQRLLSSIAAFARTLRKHRATLQRIVDGAAPAKVAAAAQAFVATPEADESLDLGLEDEAAERAAEADDDATVEAASALGAVGAGKNELEGEIA